MIGERGSENKPSDASVERTPGSGAEVGRDGEAAIEHSAESPERQAWLKMTEMVRETKGLIADALWERPAAFVEYAAERKLGPQLARFLAAFASLDDKTLLSDALRRDRDAAAGASREGLG
jgi:hypothetical protein